MCLDAKVTEASRSRFTRRVTVYGDAYSDATMRASGIKFEGCQSGF